MARCPRLDRALEGFCEDAPSKTRSGERAATPPIVHIPDAGCIQKDEIPAANSGRQRFRQS